jgi:energy-coupling factor transporter ATP-binding protein EcfA2
MTEQPEERQDAARPDSRPRRWLERLKINQFRSVEPGTELVFSDGLHVLLGKNASGKSTLLDLIAASLALDFDRPAFKDEPLSLEFTMRAGALRIEATVKRTLRSTNAPTAPGNDAGPAQTIDEEGRYTMRAPSGFAVTVEFTSDDLPRRTVEGVDPARYGLEEPLGWRHQEPPLAPSLNGLYRTWFQGSLRVYPAMETLLGKGAFSIGSRDKFIVRMPEGDELLDVLGDDDFTIRLGKSAESLPMLLPDSLFKAMSRNGSAIEVPLALEPLLLTFVREMGFTEARMSLGPPRVEQLFGKEVFAYSSPTFTFYRDGRFARRVDQLSYGQRRLFALGWYLVCNSDIAILDEPSNGLHESWVEFLIEQLRHRQVFLTSQNREMLDMLPFATETELTRGFILCESRPQPGGSEPTLHWRGLREDESALMIKALRASRVDLVSDLLRALDLW